MKPTIPGTTIAWEQPDYAGAEQLFRSMFVPGGLMLGQVVGITGLETYTVQNWVKRGFLPPPERKLYKLNQVCRVVIINMLKSALLMEQICALLAYINGRLDDTSDDTIDDSDLYFAFLDALCHLDVTDGYPTVAQRNKAVADSLADYREPIPGAKERVEQVLQVMLAAWGCAQLQRQAEKLVDGLELPIFKEK